MRKLLAGLFLGLLAGAAYAEDVWEAANEGGGMITLTSKVCEVDGVKYTPWFEARTWNLKGMKATGCWTIASDKEGTIRIVWAVDPVLVLDYPVTVFTQVGEGRI
jgi:hypothetical protein